MAHHSRLEKKNVVAPGGKGLNREEFFMADIGNTVKRSEKDIRIETAKQSYLKEMGVDTKALTPTLLLYNPQSSPLPFAYKRNY